MELCTNIVKNIYYQRYPEHKFVSQKRDAIMIL